MLSTWGMFLANITSPVTAIDTFSFGSMSTTELDGLKIVAQTAMITRNTRIIRRMSLSFISYLFILAEKLV